MTKTAILLLFLFHVHVYGHLMSFENQQWSENAPKVISEGLKLKKDPPYRVRCHVQSLHPPPLSIFLNEALQVTDEDTWSQLAHVIVQGVPADGMIDKGVDITIMGLDLFTKVDAAARLHKKTFKK